MKKLIILILLFIPLYSHAQKMLEVIDISNTASIDIFAHEDRKEALIRFVCDKSMELIFKSNYDSPYHKDILSITIDTIGTDKQYSLVIPTEGKGTSYDGRILTIYCNGFDKYEMPNFNFPAGLAKTYQVSDPYRKLKNPYFQAIDNATKLFASGNYIQAKTQLALAKQTPEYKLYNDSVDYKMAAADSIIKWRDLGDAALKEINYMTASRYFDKILKLNPQDEYVRDKYESTLISMSTDCQNYFMLAEDLFANKDYDRALTYYQKIIDQECILATQAQEKILYIKDWKESRKSKSEFFVYEYNPTTPIGFSVGTCNTHKSGGFFTLRTNVDVFHAMKGVPDESIHPRANVAFGWVIKVYPPVWFTLGPGYSGHGIWKTVLDEDNEEEHEFVWANAISPEVGVIVKFWHITLKYSFQYNFNLEPSYSDMFKKMGHYVGIGVCW